MTSLVVLNLVLVLVVTPIHSLPRSSVAFLSRDLESSGSGPEESARGSGHHHRPSPFFLRAFPGPVRPQTRTRSPFPAFLARGRAGPPESGRTQQGLDMWKRSMRRQEQVSAPINLGDLKLKDQSCAAVPFIQRVSESGCEPLSLPNKLCFGNCPSLYLPPGLGSARSCSRCAPLRARAELVHLRCGEETREKRVMVVEECKCETGREENPAESKDTHL